MMLRMAAAEIWWIAAAECPWQVAAGRADAVCWQEQEVGHASPASWRLAGPDRYHPGHPGHLTRQKLAASAGGPALAQQISTQSSRILEGSREGR